MKIVGLITILLMGTVRLMAELFILVHLARKSVETCLLITPVQLMPVRFIFIITMAQPSVIVPLQTTLVRRLFIAMGLMEPLSRSSLILSFGILTVPLAFKIPARPTRLFLTAILTRGSQLRAQMGVATSVLTRFSVVRTVVTTP